MKNKELNKMLENCKMKIEWLNCGSWTKQEQENLLQEVEDKNIKIKKDKEGRFKISIHNNDFKTEINRLDFCRLEQQLYKILQMYYIYLGDKAKLKTRFGTIKINY